MYTNALQMNVVLSSNFLCFLYSWFHLSARMGVAVCYAEPVQRGTESLSFHEDCLFVDVAWSMTSHLLGLVLHYHKGQASC